MAQIETWVDCDLKKGIVVHRIKGNVFRQDSQANKIGVRVFSGGQPVNLSGSISGKIITPDWNTITVSGTIDGNKGYIVLPSTAYASRGQITIAIKNTVGTAVTTLAAIVGNVY